MGESRTKPLTPSDGAGIRPQRRVCVDSAMRNAGSMGVQPSNCRIKALSKATLCPTITGRCASVDCLQKRRPPGHASAGLTPRAFTSAVNRLAEHGDRDDFAPRDLQPMLPSLNGPMVIMLWVSGSRPPVSVSMITTVLRISIGAECHRRCWNKWG